MMLKGRVINNGVVEAEAVVLDSPFSFIGEFDPATGKLVLEGHPLHGCSVAGKVLVCPGGKGGTIAPFIAYEAKRAGNAPAAIVCEAADPILSECALVLDIPMLDGFDGSPLEVISTGQRVRVEGEIVSVIEGQAE